MLCHFHMLKVRSCIFILICVLGLAPPLCVGSIPVELREESLLEVSEAFSHLYPSNKYIEFGQTFEYNIERTFKYVYTVTPFIVIYICVLVKLN